jgi:putative endonuclease (uncharacterized protein DUF1780)
LFSEKAAKYGAACNDLDAQMYVNLSDKFLDANSTVPDTTKLEQQGWRSVSLLFSPYGAVLFAKSDAPSFLRDVGKEAEHEVDLHRYAV